MDDPIEHQVEDYLKQHDLLSLFKHESFAQRTHRVVAGLKAPRESGEYKYAKLQLMRLSAPASAVVVPILAIGLLVVFAKLTPPPRREVQVKIVEPEAIEELEEIEELDNEPLEPPDPIDIEFTPDVTINNDQVITPSPTVDFSPQPAQFDSVAIVKSPVIMKGIFGSRNPGSRGVALREYGGSGVTEGAVLRALRWLKKFQEPDGRWTATSGMPGGDGKHPTSMTSFALLTFLAHGETPASDEFGETVEKAIRYLVDLHQAGRWGRSYEHQIATYALAEAYALTRIPMVKETAMPALDVIIQGQNPGGGWNYPLRPMDRDDTSVMAWCAQALKAGKMAGFENPGLAECMKKAIEGFKKNWDPKAGGFGYASTGPAHGQLRASGLTGAGTLSMQFLGAAKAKETRAAIAYLQERRNEFEWDNATWKSIYYWYYDTQARFHTGGKTWDEWNRKFAIPLVKNQTVLKGEGVDGKDIGYWTTTDDAHGLVMNTSLCALMLQVYYRYLPTYRPPAAEEEEVAAEEDDIEVEIIL